MYTLYIGNKNYSTWSLRAWVLMKTAGIPFREQRLLLDEPDSSARHPGSLSVGKGSMPPRRAGGGVGFDGDRGIPRRAPPRLVARRQRGARLGALGRGRNALRIQQSAQRVRHESAALRDRVVASPAVAAEIERISEIWREGRQRFGGGGDFLCGSFGIVDAFYCPVAFRFQLLRRRARRTTARRISAHLIALPAMQEWLADAMRESEHIARLRCCG